MCEYCTVNSVASSVCSRYDPNVLRHEVAVKKRHVQQLRRELENMESEVHYTQNGLQALSRYDMSHTVAVYFSLSFVSCLHML